MAAVIFCVDNEANTGEVPVSNDEVLEVAAADDDVLIPFVSIDPHRGKRAVFEAQRLIEKGARGFKFHPNLQAFFPNHRLAYPLYEVIEAAGLPALFHTGHSGNGLGPARRRRHPPQVLQPDARRRRRRRFPPTRRSSSPTHPSPGRRKRSRSPCTRPRSTSTSPDGHRSSSHPSSSNTPTTVLQDKVLFGSDYPVITPDRWLADFAGIAIKDEVRPLILKENAARLVRPSIVTRREAQRRRDRPPVESRMKRRDVLRTLAGCCPWQPRPRGHRTRPVQRMPEAELEPTRGPRGATDEAAPEPICAACPALSAAATTKGPTLQTGLGSASGTALSCSLYLRPWRVRLRESIPTGFVVQCARDAPITRAGSAGPADEPSTVRVSRRSPSQPLETSHRRRTARAPATRSDDRALRRATTSVSARSRRRAVRVVFPILRARPHLDLSELRPDTAARHPWEVARARAVASILERHGAGFAAVLDYGCGDGYTGEHVQDVIRVPHLVAVDVFLPEVSCGIAPRGAGTVKRSRDPSVLRRPPFRPDLAVRRDRACGRRRRLVARSCATTTWRRGASSW